MRKKPTISPSTTYKPKNTVEKQLIKAFTLLESEAEFADFLRDLLTSAEIEEFAHRLEIARLLQAGKKSYLEIADEVGTSTTTVTRVAQWLFRGCGGYQMILDRLSKRK